MQVFIHNLHILAFEKLRIRPGVTMALLAGLSELIGGAMFALGLLTPLAGIVILEQW